MLIVVVLFYKVMDEKIKYVATTENGCTEICYCESQLTIKLSSLQYLEPSAKVTKVKVKVKKKDFSETRLTKISL